MIMSVEGERGVDTGKRFRCVTFFHIAKGKEGRKERKKKKQNPCPTVQVLTEIRFNQCLVMLQ